MSITRLVNARRASAASIAAAGGTYPPHPEALDWQSRVAANGGNVSPSTLAAVSAFCTTIDSESGLRAAILRLNLFCGDNLSSALVPLYRGASLTGTQYGNTTDTNNGPFVAGDYSERGSSGGLKGNGTSKYLNTGFTPADWSSRTSVHLMLSGTSMETSGDRVGIGSYNGSTETSLYAIDVYAGYLNGRAIRLGTFTAGQIPVNTLPASLESVIIGTRTAATSAALYRAATFSVTNTTSITPSSTTLPMFVFALNNNSTAISHSASRFRMYSIGNGLTLSQAATLSAAAIAFNCAMSRQ